MNPFVITYQAKVDYLKAEQKKRVLTPYERTELKSAISVLEQQKDSTRRK